MPHSPHQKTIHAPIDNLGDYTSALARHRAEIEDDVRDKYRDETLLAISEELLEHCEFLEEKLRIKVPASG